MGYLSERLELARAMKQAPSHLAAGECDYGPALELVGVYTVHATVSRCVLRGQLSTAAGAYLNSALGAHAFCILHHCTHESISQHNPEHEALENQVFRLGCALIL